jgi:hypothetical protein
MTVPTRARQLLQKNDQVTTRPISVSTGLHLLLRNAL